MRPLCDVSRIANFISNTCKIETTFMKPLRSIKLLWRLSIFWKSGRYICSDIWNLIIIIIGIHKSYCNRFIAFTNSPYSILPEWSSSKLENKAYIRANHLLSTIHSLISLKIARNSLSWMLPLLSASCFRNNWLQISFDRWTFKFWRAIRKPLTLMAFLASQSLKDHYPPRLTVLNALITGSIERTTGGIFGNFIEEEGA